MNDPVLHGRLSYADHIFENRNTGPLNTIENALDPALWRGLMVRPDGKLHAGSTQADHALYARILSAGVDAIGTPVDEFLISTSVPTAEWPNDDPRLVENGNREAFSQALAEAPTQSSGEVGIEYRKTPAFFTAKHSPARVDVDKLDSGVALLVKTLPLVGVWSWCSCDGHHLLGRSPRKSVKPATIDLAEVWDAFWFAGLLKVATRTVDMRCDWHLGASSRRGYRLTIAARKTPAAKGSDDLFQRAFAQDSDMQVLARWFLREDVNEVVRDAKRRCHRAKPADRVRVFHDALVDLDALPIG